MKNILLGKIHKSRWIVSIDWGSKVAKISQCEFLAMTSFVTFAVGGWIGRSITKKQIIINDHDNRKEVRIVRSQHLIIPAVFGVSVLFQTPFAASFIQQPCRQSLFLLVTLLVSHLARLSVSTQRRPFVLDLLTLRPVGGVPLAQRTCTQ